MEIIYIPILNLLKYTLLLFKLTIINQLIPLNIKIVLKVEWGSHNDPYADHWQKFTRKL